RLRGVHRRLAPRGHHGARGAADARRRHGRVRGRRQPLLGRGRGRADRRGAGRPRPRRRPGGRDPGPGADRTEGGALIPLTAVTSNAHGGWDLALSAASAASTARSTGFNFHFDPASTLPWVVPLLLAAPVVGYVLVLGSVRSRRGAATTAQLTVVVMLA